MTETWRYRDQNHDETREQYEARCFGALNEGPQRTVAALYIQPTGCYQHLAGVDPWDEKRDARLYAGPHPVVCHSPCERWGRYAEGGPSAKVRRIKGDDDGCFEAALAAVRRWGGVLEHPEASGAWLHFGLLAPPRWGGWVPAGDWKGWTCCVKQGHYGHRARKASWLYSVGCVLPELKWGPSPSGISPDADYQSAEERHRAVKTVSCQRFSKNQRAATPPTFRDLLLSIARSARPHTPRAT